jgi:heme o synthase
MKNWIYLKLELTKSRISFLVTLSAAAGFLIAQGTISYGIIAPIIGVLFLASGSCALNQFQERAIDALMERTRKRPIPSGRISPRTALIIAVIAMFIGTGVLYLWTTITALLLGLTAVVLYNVVYTYLKRVTAFAVVPGALIGAIPPVIGYVAGGNSIFNYQIIALALFMFLWQLPHFWILMYKFGSEYERAGLPSITKIFTDTQLKLVTFILVLAMSLICLLLPLLQVITSWTIIIGLLLITARLIIDGFRFLSSRHHNSYSLLLYRDINIYALLILCLISLDKIKFFIFWSRI